MSMHLEGPWLSTTGKKKGKQKFRNAEQARKARELAASWQELQKKWAAETKNTKKKQHTNIEPWKSTSGVYRRETEQHPSLPFTAGPCTKKEQPVYTGTAIKGIGTMHKSNAVPIFSNEDAEAIAKMRR